MADNKIFYCGGWGGKTFLFDIDVLDLGTQTRALTPLDLANTLQQTRTLSKTIDRSTTASTIRDSVTLKFLRAEEKYSRTEPCWVLGRPCSGNYWTHNSHKKSKMDSCTSIIIRTQIRFILTTSICGGLRWTIRLKSCDRPRTMWSLQTMVSCSKYLISATRSFMLW